MNEEQLKQLSQAELLKLFIEKSNQVQDLQNRLTIAEAQLSSLGLVQDYIRNAHSTQWEEAVREKLEQLVQAHADLQELLNKSEETQDKPEESAEELPVEVEASPADNPEETHKEED